MIKDWKDKKVALLGFGVEGTSTAKFLHKKGAEVWAVDRRQKGELDQKTTSLLESLDVHYKGGADYLHNLSDFDIIVRSPGVKLVTPELVEAQKKGAIITSHIKLFFDYCPGTIIGVTGTKGKGTTSTLIYEMLKQAGRDVHIGGNVGFPPLDFFDKLDEHSWIVLELSSFQLQDLDKSPHIAVMLMVTSEHMDYHKDLYEYVEAKRNILSHQTKDDFTILNRDYPASNESDIYTEGKVFHVSRERGVAEGCCVENGKIVLIQNGEKKEMIETGKILLPGKHNLENVCAAVMAASVAGVTKESIVEVLKVFKGLEYRLELVREVNGARYYNDSFSTTPETAIAAIEAFTNPEILILGGSSKNSDFTELGKTINLSENIKAIIGIGDEWYRIKEQIKLDTDILLIEGAIDMKTVVAAASKIAQPGDVILLSPACASFGMFTNYKERGLQFKQEVLKL